MASPAQQALGCLGRSLPCAAWMPLALEPLALPGSPLQALCAALTALAALLSSARPCSGVACMRA